MLHGPTDSQFNRPIDIAQDGAGNLYVSDINNNHIQVFDCMQGTVLSTFGKKGAASKQINLMLSLLENDALLSDC